jgi:hypothetical protein
MSAQVENRVSDQQRAQQVLVAQGMGDVRTAEIVRIYESARLFVPLPQAPLVSVTYSTTTNQS